MKFSQWLATVSCVGGACWSQMVMAQSDDSSALPVVELPPITVTVRGIQEQHLNLPFSVASVTNRQIQQKHFINSEEAIRSLPEVSVHNGGNVSNSLLWIRGTGSLTNTSLDDNSVDFRVDGTSFGKVGLIRNLIDVASVEVAKGPQGTLLGSKAEAGSVLIKTQDPKDYFDAHLGVGLGSGQQKQLDAMVNMPLSDNVAVRIAGLHEQKDNHLLERSTGKPINTVSRQGLQAKIRWQDFDKNDVVLGGFFDRQKNFIPTVLSDINSPKMTSGGLPHRADNQIRGVSLDVKHNFDKAQLVSQTRYYRYQGEVYRPLLPLDNRALYYSFFPTLPSALRPALDAFFAQENNNRQNVGDDAKQFSQEVRLHSPSDSKSTWVVGANFEKKSRQWWLDGKQGIFAVSLDPNNPSKTTTLIGNVASNAVSRKNFDTQGYALFGELTYPVSDALELTTGLRWGKEILNYHAHWQGNHNNDLAQAGEHHDKQQLNQSALTGRTGLSFAITPKWRLYGSYARGNKFGGFADYGTNVAFGKADSPYKPTRIDAFEIGSKYQSSDKRLHVNMALFENRMQDDHVSLFLFPSNLTAIANVDSRSRGLELSGDYLLNQHWKVSGNLALTDAVVTKASPQVVAQKITKVGNHMPQVPKFSGALGVRYQDEINLGGLGHASWVVAADVRHVGSRYGQPHNLQKLKGYTLFDVHAGIIGDNHEIGVWIKNLGNTKYQWYGVMPGNAGMVAPGRSFGLNYRYHF